MRNHSNYAHSIELRVKELRRLTGIEYMTDYNSFYGGWNLYYVPQGETFHARGYFGHHYRKSNKEMLAYLDGIITGLYYYKNEE